VLESCVDGLFTCVVTKAGDQQCIDKANTSCGKNLAKIPVAGDKLATDIDKRCAEKSIRFAILRTATGANLDALAPECSTFGVPAIGSIADYEECLFRQHSCRTEELLRFQAPRAEVLLGLLTPPVTLQSDFCPVP
jgi:hypothetical protein